MKYILGVNHQFLYPQAMKDAREHRLTLQKLSATGLVDALDCWVWPEKRQADEEIRALKDSGKWINYNIGDRIMDEPCFPASPDAARRERALDILKREVGYAVECGAGKIVIGSGPDVPDDRQAGKDRFADILMRLRDEIPPGVILALEPTDRTIDKHYLFGPAGETAQFLRDMRQRGFANIGMLLDMCHIPIMGDTLETAVSDSADVLVHIHLGNCIIKNPRHPFYGDKHVPWGIPESEYGAEEAAAFASLLCGAGYFAGDHSTVSFEMRCYEGTSPEESLQMFLDIWNESLPVKPASK